MKYAKSHEWAKVDGDTATIGISDFAQVRTRFALCGVTYGGHSSVCNWLC